MRKRLKSAALRLATRRVPSLFSWRWKEAFVGIAFASLLSLPTRSHAVAITAIAFTNTRVTYEQGGVPNGTTAQVTIDTDGSVTMDVAPSQNSGVTDSTVSRLTQSCVHTTPCNFFWNGLWTIDGLPARHSGTYEFSFSLSTGTGATPVTAVSNTLVELASVDIHSISINGVLDPSTNNNNFPYTISYALAKDATVSVVILNSSGTLVRTLVDNKPQSNETVSTHTVTWDGRNASGASVPIGTYTVGITAKDLDTSLNSFAIPRSVPFGVLLTTPEDPKKLFEDSTYVYPNPIRDGQGIFQYIAARDGASLRLRIYTITGTLVLDKDLGSPPTGVAQNFPWDATNQSGNKVGRGLYFYVMRENDPQGVLQVTKKLAVIK